MTEGSQREFKLNTVASAINTSRRRLASKLLIDFNPFNPLKSYAELGHRPSTTSVMQQKQLFASLFESNEVTPSTMSKSEVEYRRMLKSSSSQGLRDEKNFNLFKNHMDRVVDETEKHLQATREELHTLEHKTAAMQPKKQFSLDTKSDWLEFFMKETQQIRNPEELKKFFKEQISVYNTKNLVEKYKEKKTKEFLEKMITEVRLGFGDQKPVKYLVNDHKLKESLIKPMMVPYTQTTIAKRRKLKLSNIKTHEQRLYLFPDRDNFKEFFQDTALRIADDDNSSALNELPSPHALNSPTQSAAMPASETSSLHQANEGVRIATSNFLVQEPSNTAETPKQARFDKYGFRLKARDEYRELLKKRARENAEKLKAENLQEVPAASKYTGAEPRHSKSQTDINLNVEEREQIAEVESSEIQAEDKNSLLVPNDIQTNYKVVAQAKSQRDKVIRLDVEIKEREDSTSSNKEKIGNFFSELRNVELEEASEGRAIKKELDSLNVEYTNLENAYEENDPQGLINKQIMTSLVSDTHI